MSLNAIPKIKERVYLVIPCFNEENRLDADAFRVFASKNPLVHILFVNDGSRDGTERLLKDIVQNSVGQFSMLRLEENVGKGNW